MRLLPLHLPLSQIILLTPTPIRDKHVGRNNLNWIHSLRITLRHEKKEYILDEEIPEEPYEDAIAEEFAYYKKHCKSLD